MPLINNKDLSEIGLSEKQSFSVEQWQMNISEYAAVVEQVDTSDLKSDGWRHPCRFDSGQRHHRPKQVIKLLSVKWIFTL